MCCVGCKFAHYATPASTDCFVYLSLRDSSLFMKDLRVTNIVTIMEAASGERFPHSGCPDKSSRTYTFWCWFRQIDMLAHALLASCRQEVTSNCSKSKPSIVRTNRHGRLIFFLLISSTSPPILLLFLHFILFMLLNHGVWQSTFLLQCYIDHEKFFFWLLRSRSDSKGSRLDDNKASKFIVARKNNFL